VWPRYVSRQDLFLFKEDSEMLENLLELSESLTVRDHLGNVKQVMMPGARALSLSLILSRARTRHAVPVLTPTNLLQISPLELRREFYVYALV